MDRTRRPISESCISCKSLSVSSPRVEIVSIGNELLRGLPDTNASEIAARLGGIGLGVTRSTVVPDDTGRIRDALSSALERAEVVIATGGLGPTLDDVTRWALAEALGHPLEVRPEAVRHVRDRLKRPLTERDERQTLVPRGARIIPNPAGSAPGIRAELEGKLVCALPGVPAEMKGMLEEHVLPELDRRGRRRGGLRHSRSFVTYGAREAELDARLDAVREAFRDVVLGTCVEAGACTVTVTAGSPGELEGASGAVRSALDVHLFAEDESRLVDAVARELLDRSLTVALAESCTGGLLAATLVDVPGASGTLLEAVVAYSNETKVRRLGVPRELIDSCGAVSPEVAAAMAEGARRGSGADIGLGVTGVAGPNMSTREARDRNAPKPVGLVYIAVASSRACEQGSTTGGEVVEVVERRFRGGRTAVRERAVQAALWLLGGAARSLGPARCGAIRPAEAGAQTTRKGSDCATGS